MYWDAKTRAVANQIRTHAPGRMFSLDRRVRSVFGVLLCLWLLLALRSLLASSPGDSHNAFAMLEPSTAAATSLSLPLPPSSSPSSPSPSSSSSSSYSYVFYATSDEYACSALVNVQRLQTLFKTTARIVVLATASVSDPFLAAFRVHNVTVFMHEAPPLADGSVEYYQNVLLKLVSFKLHHLDASLKRIVVMDSDQLILKPLDDLFTLPDVDVAAPRAYWISKEAASSTFMLVMLSERLWRRIEIAMRDIMIDKYDMDLINDVLGWEMMLLPGHYAAINSHWEVSDVPKWFRDSDEEGVPPTMAPGLNSTDTATIKKEHEKASRSKLLYRIYEQASVLHFFALGKPWSYTVEQVRREKPDAHPLFAEQFSTWRTTAAEVCPGVWNGSFIEII